MNEIDIKNDNSENTELSTYQGEFNSSEEISSIESDKENKEINKPYISQENIFSFSNLDDFPALGAPKVSNKIYNTSWNSLKKKNKKKRK